MAKQNRKNKKPETEKSGGSNKTGTIAILVLVGVVAVMVWGTLGIGKPTTTVDNTVQLPAYAYASAKSEQAYRASIDPAVLNGDVFSKIPCYCGCVNVGHTSLKDCFLDNHGSFCDVCQYEAFDTYDMVKKGVPVTQIRSTIDQKYGTGLGPGTNTPPVA